MTHRLGRLGIWRDHQLVDPDFARRAEQLGYGAIWLGFSPGGDLGSVDDLLEATSTLVIATGIVNIWRDDPARIARAYHRISAKYPDRFLLGIGAGHREHTQEFAKPYTALVDYLDALDNAAVPRSGRVLAALGTQVLTLAGDRTAGAHPYLTTPEHSERARRVLGPEPLLAPEQKVVFTSDAVKAREIGRPVAKFYLGLRNYQSSLRSLGFTENDLGGDGSDRLVDALILHGTTDKIARGITAHLDAGADHVNIQVLDENPWPALEALAEVLL